MRAGDGPEESRRMTEGGCGGKELEKKGTEARGLGG